MLYNLIRGVLYPFIVLFLIFKPKKIKFFRDRFFQDLSFLNRDKNYIWIHCSSVGEVTLLDGFIKELLKIESDRILLSTFTDTGFDLAYNKYLSEERVDVIRFPLDDIFILRRILYSITLSKLIIVETELWPNLVRLASKYAKIYLINGRISSRSFKRYRYLQWILIHMFDKIDKFCMQSKSDADNIIQLGASRDRVYVTGNLKFDVHFEEFSELERENLKKLINPEEKKLFVIGSSRKGEESYFINVLKEIKNIILVIVPRHLERIKNIENLFVENKINYIKYSELEARKRNNDFDVIIVDKLGILKQFYSIADYTFVGGTLVDIGGHNLLEPLFYGKIPIFGPYLQNVKEISKEILSLEIGFKVENTEEIIELIKSDKISNISSNKIDEFFIRNRDAVKKTLDIMEER